MKSRKTIILLAGIFLVIAAAGCKPGTVEPKAPSSAEQTQAVMFAQATITKMALENEINNLVTQQVELTQAAETEAVQPPTTELPTNTAVPPTATQIPPTATSVPPTAVPPTNTSVPPAISEIRINFQTGNTNGNVVGAVRANTLTRYVFWGAEGQLMDVSLSSGQSAWIAVQSRDGRLLLSGSSKWTSYRGYLPVSGDYFIDVYAGSSDVNFELYLMIPQRLSFATGTYGMDFDDSVPAGGVHNYIVYAFKDQTLTVKVGPEGKVAISIWGVDGTVLLSSMGESITFVGKLPSTQDWIINVRSVPGTDRIYYDFMIDIRY